MDETTIEISVREAADLLKQGGTRLVDVRTPEENAIARINGALLADGRAAEDVLGWPKDTPIIVHCHHGVRSLYAAETLRERGFTKVWSMAGGIDAWSAEIDPQVPRY